MIAILAFLSDLVRDIRQYAIPSEMPMIPCDRLINNQFMALFSNEVLRNYINYMPPREELLDEEGLTKLINGLIAAKMKMDNLTIDELMQRKEKLQKSSEKLQKNLIESDCMKYFKTIEEQFTDKQNEFKKLTEMLTEKRKFLKMITIIHDEKRRQLATKQTELNELMSKIDKQKYTILDMKQLIAKETSIKSSIAMLQAEINGIQTEAADAQVKLARYQKLKIDTIKKFNDFTFQIIKELVQCRSFQHLNVIDFTIDPIASFETIQNICHQLNGLNESCTIVKRQRIEQIQQNQIKLIDAKMEYNRLNEKYAEEMIKNQKVTKTLDDLNQKCLNYENNGNVSTVKLRREIDEKIAQKKYIDDEIHTVKMKAQKMELKNVQLFEAGEQKAQQIIRAKQMLCHEMDKLNQLIDKYNDKFFK